MECKPTKITYLLWGVMILAWAALMFHLSTRPFSPSFSRGLLAGILHFLHLQVSWRTFNLLHALLRKSAHLTEYAIFALMLYSFPHEEPRGFWQPRRAVICIAIAAAYSLTDEFHQMFVPGRHASLLDCELDTIGAMLAMLVPYARKQIWFLRTTSSLRIRTRV